VWEWVSVWKGVWTGFGIYSTDADGLAVAGRQGGGGKRVLLGGPLVVICCWQWSACV
jgi:hypothetical protein